MMVEQAVVVEYRDGIAKVQCYAKSACGGCSANGSCGTKSLSALSGEKFVPEFYLEVNETLNVGDKIAIGLAEKSVLNSVFLLYGIPLFSLLASTFIFSSFITNELITAMAIVITTLFTFAGIKLFLNHTSQQAYIPQFLYRI
ncbi:RseC/MucC-like positive regulator of sigma(E) [Nicoletella semolina]|uniref:RseC/MucC-like positive regulator of sigma(E) n=1 Tax=Nicoletella semolina TaxID=271160 RepID=A0A4R2N8C8_9PAST|nr:SoxR reducing system RseC family protein [Nicoletella semolina]MDH2923907.1 transcriptional regulator [Nicoletella semolina]TCP17222.1 RseC/MucC-like positive regulator of sigma(E) [Nicoletella semolina]